MSDPIKHCPYRTCGHQAQIEHYPDPDTGDHWQVECTGCQATGPFCDTEDAAIQEWNAIERHEPKLEPALEPCPCCGAKANYGHLYRDGYFVACSVCRIATAVHETKLMAAAKWNARPGKEQP